MKEIDEKEAFELSMDIGSLMLKSGGEVSRVEDTVERINTSFNAKKIEVSALPSLIVATVITSKDERITESRRIKEEVLDMALLNNLNLVSREICSGNRNFISTPSTHQYKTIVNVFMTFLATASFCIYFGGTIRDAIFSGIFGIIISYVHIGWKISEFASVLIDSTFAGILSFLPSVIGINSSPDKIMIGTIMLLVPGLTVSNAMRDMINGDIIAGLLRLVSAIITALAIAFGFAASVKIFSGDII